MVQKKLKRDLIGLRSDHGTKFKNSKFLKFYTKIGISHNFYAPKTPQQNGVNKWKNRTLEGIARNMLIDSSLPQSY